MKKRYVVAVLLLLGLLAACAPPTTPATKTVPTPTGEPALDEADSGDDFKPAESGLEQADSQSTPAPIAIPDADAVPGQDATEKPAKEQPPFTAPDPGKRLMVEQARRDLAQQLNVPLVAIQVIEVQEMQWPDAGLGCPQPEEDYAQVITPGYWILLEARAQFYRYHTDETERIQLCSQNGRLPDGTIPLPPLIPVKPGEIDDGEPWVPVD